jgi:hypothetical protein
MSSPAIRGPDQAKGHLRDHLMRQHRRPAREIEGLPLAALHRFEHLEQTMGLIQLDHVHRDGDVPLRATNDARP